MMRGKPPLPPCRNIQQALQRLRYHISFIKKKQPAEKKVKIYSVVTALTASTLM
jgi:hypothetical protein